ncbi:unnamed protein product [Tetraodon nigroviridis]|uniref:(spotted green pufferfish) hypothetical protein n=1 Tax=Tetraodon nigroviridis TaxID=99883 RepID=Q4SH30_TETNG|nr:unnamed protein product [Tetraodon nigroviridis]
MCEGGLDDRTKLHPPVSLVSTFLFSFSCLLPTLRSSSTLFFSLKNIHFFVHNGAFAFALSLQVLIEATISRERQGYIAVDDIMVLNYPCYKAPHFSRLGDEEVNAGQNASFQCVAAGRASEAERFLLENIHHLPPFSIGLAAIYPFSSLSNHFKRHFINSDHVHLVLQKGIAQMAHIAIIGIMTRHNGETLTAASVKHLSHRRFVVSFQLDNVQRADQDLYRCVTQSSRGSGVSNFAELIVKVPPSPIAPPQLLRAGSTYLIVQLNTNSILGDGPIIRKEIEYRASQSPWSEVHAVNMVTYKLWHLDPDTEYHISVLLTRPGEGGTGPPGPPLVSRTKCAGELWWVEGQN